MKLTLATVLVLISALTLGGCSAASDSASTQSGGLAPDVAEVAAGSDSGGLASDPSKGGVSGPVADRLVIVTGYLTMTVDDPLTASAEAARIAESVGGRVDGRTEYAPTDGDKGSAMLVLRLPSKDLTATLEKLRALGDVEELSLSTADVTTDSQDLDARITALTASVDRLLALLEKSTDTDTLISLESAISDRQAQLESLESQRRYLDDQVTLSTITLTLGSVADAPVDTPENFWSGLVAGWNSLVAFLGVVAVSLGVLLPWIVVLGFVTLIVLWVIRGVRRRTLGARTGSGSRALAADADPVDDELLRKDS
jgi:hypothetical protein